MLLRAGNHLNNDPQRGNVNLIEWTTLNQFLVRGCRIRGGERRGARLAHGADSAWPRWQIGSRWNLSWSGFATPTGQPPSGMRFQELGAGTLATNHAGHETQWLLVDGTALNALGIARAKAEHKYQTDQ